MRGWLAFRWNWTYYYPFAMLALLGPALVNGYPLFFPDAMDYLGSGHRITRRVLAGQPSAFYGTRSELFSLSTFPLHLKMTPWPLVLASALFTAWTVKVFFVRLLPGTKQIEALLAVVGLCLLTPLAWHTSTVMPDYLAGLVLAWLVLLGVVPQRFNRIELLAGAALLCYGMVSHTATLALAAALSLLLLLGRGRRAWIPAAVLLAALLLQVSTQLFLYGKLRLLGEHPPFLMARVMVDGPGRHYMKEHDDFVVCRYRHIPVGDKVVHWLWSPEGLRVKVKQQHPEDWAKIKAEEMAFVAAAVRAYPMMQLRASAHNFFDQLVWLGHSEVRNSGFIEDFIGKIFPQGLQHYQATLQYQGRIPAALLGRLQAWVGLLALLLGGFCLGRSWRTLPSELRWLTLLVLGALLVNAFVTGVGSVPTSRYQSRISWLLSAWALILWRHPASEE